VLAPGEENQQVTLAASHQAEAVAVMQATTGRPETADRPARAPRGVRWSDVPLALANACDEEGVEMTVVRARAYDAQDVEMTGTRTRDEQPHKYVFDLRTVENWPGQLVVRRGDGGQVYDITEVSIGRFPDDPDRVDRAEALVKAFKEQLERLGDQAWFND
jgi:hypothetical protein